MKKDKWIVSSSTSLSELCEKYTTFEIPSF